MEILFALLYFLHQLKCRLTSRIDQEWSSTCCNCPNRTYVPLTSIKSMLLASYFLYLNYNRLSQHNIYGTMRYDNNFPSLKIEKNTFRGNRSFFAQLEQHEKLHESHEQVSDQLWRAFTSLRWQKILASCSKLNPHVCRNFSIRSWQAFSKDNLYILSWLQK